MSILPIYLYGTDVLRKKAKPVKRVTDDIVKLVMDMFATMRNAHGIGLAATQVGKFHRVVVIDISDIEKNEEEEEDENSEETIPRGEGWDKPLTLINPEIIARDGEATVEEGCLSIPDVRDRVDRVESILIRYRDTNFEEHELQADNLLARVILHEIDHLDGVLFLDHLTADQRKLHKEALKQIQRGEIETSYPVIVAAEVTA